MRYLLSTLLTLFLAAHLVPYSPARAKNAPSETARGRVFTTAQTGARNAQSKGDVDLLLQRLRKSKDTVVERCLENCKASRGLEGVQLIEKPQPAYPANAGARRVPGKVVVRVVIDEEGKVMAAQAVSGNALLRPAAVKSAKRARFSPTLLSGQPVKVSGVISYNFVLQ
jgi:TonB family protein